MYSIPMYDNAQLFNSTPQLLCKCFRLWRYFWLGMSLITAGPKFRPMQSTSPVGDVGWQCAGTTPLLSDETRREDSVRWTFPGSLKTVTVSRPRRGHFPGNRDLSSFSQREMPFDFWKEKRKSWKWRLVYNAVFPYWNSILHDKRRCLL